jgi:hypothetical protein
MYKLQLPQHLQETRTHGEATSRGDDTPVAVSGNTEVGRQPVPSPDHGAIHTVTDVIGATAVLRGPAGRVLNKCETPGS